MDKLAALSVLVAVAECRSFAGASRRLGVAATSVMRYVDALEKSLGTSLVTRTTRNTTLTEAGVKYVDQIARILEDLAAADESVIDSREEVVGALRVSVPATFSRIHLAPKLADFLREHPQVSIDLVVADSQLDLVSERLDVAIRIGVPYADESLVVRPLSNNERFVVGSPEYVRRFGAPEDPTQLADHECIRFSYKPGKQQWCFTIANRTVTVDVSGRVLTNNLDVILGAALSGHGFALLPSWLVVPFLRSGELVALFKDAKVTPEGGEAMIYASYLPTRRHSRKVQAFIEFVADVVQKKA